MERLTKRYGSGIVPHKFGIACSVCCDNCSVGSGDCDDAKNMVVRLAAIEDVLGDTYDLAHLRELVQADQDGRVRFVSKVSGDVCGTCKHFERFSGRKMGACRVKKFAQDRRGREDRSREFVASQSRRACKKYEPREE